MASILSNPIGNLDATAIRDLANTIKMRAIGRWTDPVRVFVDRNRDVFAVPSKHPDDPFDPDEHAMVGTYTRKASIGEIAGDLICARDEEMAKRRAALTA